MLSLVRRPQPPLKCPSVNPFKMCCPGHPYSYPEWYFTPLPTNWQQPDFRPLQFAQETRFSSKDGCLPTFECCSPGPDDPLGESYRLGYYQDSHNTIVTAWKSNDQKSDDLILQLMQDPLADKVYVLVKDDKDRQAFIAKFRMMKTIGKFRPILPVCESDFGSSCTINSQSIKDFAKRYLNGQSFQCVLP
jgi:hypothetical protein